ncbi:hypothetical protein [Pseudonocardia sp. ICBG162]|uniref:hypothetical protein n=1 Tax=Pseudonocardia sp. ICBG162 TaxID=2846761 RepID=UPI001CF6EE39|nr:hypothetical protein [Pseudonocardia sp. ICBG162]
MSPRLRPLRRHEILTRSVYAAPLPEPGGPGAMWTVEVDQARDWDARLYRDGEQVARAEMPASLPVPGGRIEVDAGLYGITRMHLVTPDGGERRLPPVPGTLEYRRARLARRSPAVSRTIAAVAVVVLLVNLVLAIPVAPEMLTGIDAVAARFGTFTSPVTLPGWLNTGLLVAGVVAAAERALTWRRHRVVDAETIWTAL